MLALLQFFWSNSNNVLKTFLILFNSTSNGFSLGIDAFSEEEDDEVAFEDFSEDIKEDEKYFCSAESALWGTKSS